MQPAPDALTVKCGHCPHELDLPIIPAEGNRTNALRVDVDYGPLFDHIEQAHPPRPALGQ